MVNRLFLLVASALLTPSWAGEGDMWELVLLKGEEKAKRAVCLDGSAPGESLKLPVYHGRHPGRGDDAVSTRNLRASDAVGSVC